MIDLPKYYVGTKTNIETEQTTMRICRFDDDVWTVCSLFFNPTDQNNEIEAKIDSSSIIKISVPEAYVKKLHVFVNEVFIPKRKALRAEYKVSGKSGYASEIKVPEEYEELMECIIGFIYSEIYKQKKLVEFVYRVAFMCVREDGGASRAFWSIRNNRTNMNYLVEFRYESDKDTSVLVTVSDPINTSGVKSLKHSELTNTLISNMWLLGVRCVNLENVFMNIPDEWSVSIPPTEEKLVDFIDLEVMAIQKAFEEAE